MPSSRDLPDPGVEPVSLIFPAWQAGSLPLAPPGKPCDSISQQQMTCFLLLNVLRAHALPRLAIKRLDDRVQFLTHKRQSEAPIATLPPIPVLLTQSSLSLQNQPQSELQAFMAMPLHFPHRTRANKVPTHLHI